MLDACLLLEGFFDFANMANNGPHFADLTVTAMMAVLGNIHFFGGRGRPGRAAARFLQRGGTISFRRAQTSARSCRECFSG